LVVCVSKRAGSETSAPNPTLAQPENHPCSSVLKLLKPLEIQGYLTIKDAAAGKQAVCEVTPRSPSLIDVE